MSKYVYILIILCAAAQMYAVQMTNYTDTVGIDITDMSFSPFTLTLDLADVRVSEFLPFNSNVVARVNSATFSLSVIRALFLMHMYVDEARVDGLFLRLLQKPDGSVSLFSPGVDTNDITQLFGGEEKKQDIANDAKEKASGDVTIPHVVFSDIHVVCSNLEDQIHIWSLDNARFELHHFSLPMEENDDTWQLCMRTSFNGNDKQKLSLNAAFRTWLYDPYMHIAVTGTRVTAALFDTFFRDEDTTNTVSGATHEKENTGAKKKKPGIIDMCFSNEWAQLENAFEAQSYALRTHPGISNYFTETVATNITFDIIIDVTITNKSFRPGTITSRFYSRNDISPELSIEYSISNTPQLLYGPYVDYFPMDSLEGDQE